MKKAMIIVVSFLAIFWGSGVCRASELADKNEVTVYLQDDNQFVVRAAVALYEEERANVLGTEREKEWPEISWNLVDKSYLSDEEFQVMLIDELQAGKGPDLIISDNDGTWDIQFMMGNGLLLDISDFSDENPDTQYLAGVMEACQIQGRQYMWPLAVEVPVFFGYRQVLESAGLTGEFANLEEFLAAALKAQEDTGIPVFENAEILEWLRYYGKEIDSAEASHSKELLNRIEVADTEDMNQGVYEVSELLDAGECLLGACGTCNPAKMFINLSQMEQDELMIYSVPSWDGINYAVVSAAVGVNANSKNPQGAMAALQAFRSAKEIAFFWDDMPALTSVGWENLAGVYWYSVEESPYWKHAENIGTFSRTGSVAELYLENVQKEITEAILPQARVDITSTVITEKEPQVITVMYKGHYLGESDLIGKWIRKAAADFSNDEIYVEVIEVYRPQLVFAQQYAQLEQCGVAPDILIVDNQDIVNLPDEDTFADISLFKEKYGEELEMLYACDRIFLEYEGKEILMPIAARAYGAWYDESMTESDVNRIKVMTDAKQYALGLLSGMSQEDGDLFLKQEDGTWSTNRAAWELAVGALSDLINQAEVENLSLNDISMALQSEEGFVVLGSSELASMINLETDVQMLKKMQFMPISNYVSGVSAGISAKSDEKEAALQFIIKALQHEAYAEYLDKTGLISVIESTYEVQISEQKVDAEWIKQAEFLPVQKNAKPMKELWQKICRNKDSSAELAEEYYPFPFS